MNNRSVPESLQQPYELVTLILTGGKDTLERLPCVNMTSTATFELMSKAGVEWREVHADPEKMARLAAEAHRTCRLDIVTVPFDMTVEAEALGAKVELPTTGLHWPNVREQKITDPEEVSAPENPSEKGRVKIVCKAVRKLKSEFDGKVPINVFMAPPFTSIGYYLVGLPVFSSWMIKHPQKIHQILGNLLPAFLEIARTYQECGADIITLHEMGAATTMISPTHFREIVKPYLTNLIREIRIPVVLNMCGRIEPIIPDMADCNPSGIAVDELTSIKTARQLLDKTRPRMPLIGNISPTKTLHLGPGEKIRREVKTVIEDGVDAVAAGCDFWLETPTQHLREFVDAVREYGIKQPAR